MNVLNATIDGQPNEYLRILDEAWEQHLAPRQPDAPTVISLFCGAGGSSLGYSMAGYKELLAVEWDDHAVACFKLNFPEVPVYHGDIAKLSVEHILDMTGLQPGELDVLDGSPPCQSFSTTGKRVLKDPRNSLFREHVRLLRGLQPKAFVMENVSGLVKGKMKLVFAEIMRALKASGYQVSARLMNAMYFGVPQNRERIIFVGIHDDLSLLPNHPKAARQPFGPLLDKEGTETLFLSNVEFSKMDSHKQRHLAKGNGFGWQEVTSRKPCATIVRGMLIGGSSARLVRDGNRFRYLSDHEIRQIGGFPDTFRFLSRPSMIALIGNSVPPLFMRAIATHVAQLLRPDRALSHEMIHNL